MIGGWMETSGRLGEVQLEAMVNEVGPKAQIGIVGVGDDDDPALLRPEADKLLHQLDTGEGVLVLTDIFGSSPSNLALSHREPGHVEVVSVVKVPMLVKLAKTRVGLDLEGFIEKSTMAGRKYIAVASQLPDPCLHGGPRPCVMPVP